VVVDFLVGDYYSLVADPESVDDRDDAHLDHLPGVTSVATSQYLGQDIVRVIRTAQNDVIGRYGGSCDALIVIDQL